MSANVECFLESVLTGVHALVLITTCIDRLEQVALLGWVSNNLRSGEQMLVCFL